MSPDVLPGGFHLVAHVRSACASLPGTIETFPFDDRNLVFKTGGDDPDGGPPVWRMYAMVDVTEDVLRLLVKVEPARSARLRETYPQLTSPGYFGGHWVFVPLDGRVPETLARELLVSSYDLVVTRNLPRRIRARLPTRSR
ncbi:MmcQ/YjbR family DNA-binding protein [Deinococcus pimensis]|uniref:MmcQ/YjbR family DNA-binding protein n=1 Tax=Deinococcus pimensis TaxID=309888 RepID=UPI0004AF2DD8|nr:MmcQ/YjbR family DNA-binding protein [Deinococcus pimensis]